MTPLINTEKSRGIFPKFLYKRITLNEETCRYTYKIDQSYGFFIRRILSKYPGFVQTYQSGVPYALTPASTVKVELLDIANNRVYQPSPYLVNLISTPGGHNAEMTDSAKDSPRYSSILNYLMRYGDLLYIQITGQRQLTEIMVPGTETPVSVDSFWNPGYIDICVCGYYVPETSFVDMKG